MLTAALRLDQSVRADTGGAYVASSRCSVLEDTNPLDVGVEATLVAPVGVRETHPEARLLATNFAHACHVGAPFGNGFE